jgi:hypothetical protein
MGKRYFAFVTEKSQICAKSRSPDRLGKMSSRDVEFDTKQAALVELRTDHDKEEPDEIEGFT